MMSVSRFCSILIVVVATTIGGNFSMTSATSPSEKKEDSILTESIEPMDGSTIRSGFEPMERKEFDMEGRGSLDSSSTFQLRCLP